MSEYNFGALNQMTK